MSVVGPRPQLVRDMVFMTPEQRMRHTAKPGLSGLAQVNGRNAISWEDKLEYCKNADFVFNLAGVNRPENPEDFMKGNFGFASVLLDTLKKHENKAGIMLY